MKKTLAEQIQQVAYQIQKETTLEGLREQCAILADLMLTMHKGVRHAIGTMQEYGFR